MKQYDNPTVMVTDCSGSYKIAKKIIGNEDKQNTRM